MPSRTLLKTAALGLMSSLLIATLARRRARLRHAGAGQGKTWHRTLSDGLSAESAGEGAGEGAGESRQAADALRAAEIPAAGFPAESDDDADRIHPGLPDFARGA